MASGEGDRDGSLYRESESINKLTKTTENMRPDSVENVAQQTEGVFRNFVYQRYLQEDLCQDFESTPNFPEVTNFTEIPLSPTAQIGRQLARIGDDVNRRYSHTFDNMICSLDITSENAYESFANITKKLLLCGEINWGRIVALFCFGYRIARHIFQQRMPDVPAFFQKIINFVVKFITDNIANWIAGQGGWIASQTYNDSPSGWSIGFILGFAFLTVLSVYFLNRKN